MNWSAVSAVAASTALILAIVSPIATAYMNNHHQLKLKKLEIETIHQAKIIEGYVSSAGEAIAAFGASGTLKNFGNYSGQVYLYISSDLWDYIDSINERLWCCDYPAAQIPLKELCKKLSEENIRKV